MNVSPGENSAQRNARFGRFAAESRDHLLDSSLGRNSVPIAMLDDEPPARAGDPGTVILTCANCGAEMIERKCKLICRCGYFLSCSDYH